MVRLIQLSLAKALGAFYFEQNIRYFGKSHSCIYVGVCCILCYIILVASKIRSIGIITYLLISVQCVTEYKKLKQGKLK
jgi:hypothetical protein